MSQAYNTFMDSYFKRLKRPELFNYSPDQSFGANMVHGSEEENPWANRNQDNAKYGNMGGNNNKVVQGPQAISGGQLDPSLAGKTFTLPSTNPNSQTQGALDTIMGAVTKPVGEYVGNAASDWLNPTPTLSDLSSRISLAGGEGTVVPDIVGKLAGLGENPLAGFDPTMGAAGDAFAGIGKEMTQGSTDMLKGAIEGGSGAIPLAGGAMGLLTDTITGKLMKDPLSSIGKTGGALGGAALGSAIMPGIGTLLGGMLGGTGGGFLGKLVKKLFG